MSEYFYIVSRLKCKVPLVLESSGNAIHVNSARPMAYNQLWRWDTGCRLVSKLGLVLDIKDGKKGAGTCLVAKAKNNDLSQMWRVEQKAIKSTLNDLVVEATSVTPGSVTRMYKAQETSLYQKWILVPKDAWDNYKLMIDDPNALIKAEFLKILVDKYLYVIIGYSINDYKSEVNKAVETIKEAADNLDKVANGTGIVNTVGGSASIAGGGMAIAGLLLAPITGGVSLGLTVAGSLTGTAGAITSFTGTVINTFCESSDAKKTKQVTAPLFRATLGLQALLNEYQQKLQKAAEFLWTPVGQKVAIDAGHLVKHGIKIVGKGTTIVQLASSSWKHHKKAQKIKSLVKVIKYDFYKTHAINAAAPAVKIPVVGKTLATAGSTSAKVLSSSFTILGMGFAARDIADGVTKIKDGSELAREFRKTAREFYNEAKELIERYKELQKLNASKMEELMY